MTDTAYEALLQIMLYELGADDLAETFTEAARRLNRLSRFAQLRIATDHTTARSLWAYSE